MEIRPQKNLNRKLELNLKEDHVNFKIVKNKLNKNKNRTRPKKARGK
jgi:hypothetical protein